MRCRLKLGPEASLECYLLHALTGKLISHCCSNYIESSKLACSHCSTCTFFLVHILEREQNLWRWKANYLQYNEDNSLGGNPLSKKSFFFFLQSNFFLTVSLGESHCAAANSKKCLFCERPLESGSKAFSQQLKSVIEIFNSGARPHAIVFSLVLPLASLAGVFPFLCIMFSFTVPPALVFTLSHLFSFSKPFLLH